MAIVNNAGQWRPNCNLCRKLNKPESRDTLYRTMVLLALGSYWPDMLTRPKNRGGLLVETGSRLNGNLVSLRLIFVPPALMLQAASGSPILSSGRYVLDIDFLGTYPPIFWSLLHPNYFADRVSLRAICRMVKSLQERIIDVTTSQVVGGMLTR